MPCRVYEFLRDLGFVEDYRSDVVGLHCRFGKQVISAVETYRIGGGLGVFICGNVFYPGGMCIIEYWIPVEVESQEQALAFVSYALKNVPRSVQLPSWVEVGKTHWHTLPWERDRFAYDSRPQCVALRDWVRVGLKTLADKLEFTDGETPVRFAFDGEILAVRVNDDLIAFPASGKRWTQEYQVLAGDLLGSLPKRLGYWQVTFHVWQGYLMIEHRHRYPCLHMVAKSVNEIVPEDAAVH